MENKIFNKYLLIFTIAVLVLAGGVKTYSFSTAPKISDWNSQQLQKINNSSPNFSFAVMGDNRDGDSVFHKIIRDINEDKNIKFALDDGDLVPDGYSKEFKNYIQEIRNSQVPIISIIGNHEIPWYDGETNYEKIFGKTYFSFHSGKTYFIVLDDSNEESIGQGQFNWLENELKISQKYQNRFVFMHVPLYDPRGGNYKQGHSLSNLSNVKKLNNLFDEYNVSMLFCSHIHFYYRGQWQKTPFIITGGAGAPLKEYKNHGFYNYIKVTINGSKIRYDVIKIKGPSRNIWEDILSFFADNFIDLILLTASVYLVAYAIFVKRSWVVEMTKKYF